MQRSRHGPLAASALILLAACGAPAAAASRVDAPRIIGGDRAAEGAYPWMAHLSVVKAGGATSGCGGSVISPDIVLTAAHCLAGATRVTADIGRVNWAAAAISGGRRTGTAFITGPGEGRGDWAVVRLTRRYTPAVYPRLPGNGSFDAGGTFRAIGWGLTSVEGTESPVLRQVDLPAVPDRRCGARRAAEICAGDWSAGGVDTCAGDSGGPLLYADRGRWVQVGITSWGYGCAAPRHPGHYTRVSAFLPRIRAAIASLGGAPPAT